MFSATQRTLTSLLLFPRNAPALSTALSPYSTSALDWLASFTNYEQKGVPAAAGTDTADGFDLQRVHRLLDALGSPQTQWPAVHVAGTKGKGSTVAMIAAILKSSGYTVGTYTSPHITSLHERIAINGTPISSADLDALVAHHKATVEAAVKAENGALSHFEILTALAFKHFADSKIDVAVIETGLGGSRDATNVLPGDTLAAAVITAMGSDHLEALGGSSHSIASAKAGILKHKRPLIVGRQPLEEAEKVVMERAAVLECPVVQAPQQVRFHSGAIAVQSDAPRNFSCVYQNSRLHLVPGSWAATALQSTSTLANEGGIAVRVGLVGEHQLDNAATAVATAAQLASLNTTTSSMSSSPPSPPPPPRFSNITIETVVRGLESVVLPGRFQVLRLDTSLGGDANSDNNDDNSPGFDRHGGAQNDELLFAVLDGAHTPESAAALSSTLRTAFPTAPVALVLAMASDKDHRGVCAALLSIRPSVAVFTEVPVAGGRVRSAAPGALVGSWQYAGMVGASLRETGRGAQPPLRTRVLIQASLKAAVVKAVKELQGDPSFKKEKRGVVLVTGSLHAAGAALKDLKFR